jgi:hypothetical protein
MSYPSENHAGANGFRGGPKSPEAKALAYDVEEAAREAIAAGWQRIEFPCRCSITRYKPDARVADAVNVGGVECNSLTRAGVWTDDEIGRPITLDVQPKSDGPDRVVIVVQRVTAPVGAIPRAPRGQAPRNAGKAPATVPDWKPGDAIPDGYALLGGKLISRAEAMAKIESGGR